MALRSVKGCKWLGTTGLGVLEMKGLIENDGLRQIVSSGKDIKHAFALSRPALCSLKGEKSAES